MPKLIVKKLLPIGKAYFGGHPYVPLGYPWPMCKTCAKPMRFLAQVPLEEAGLAGLSYQRKFLLIFQCESQPGLCDEWLSDGGGNAAVIVDSVGAKQMLAPPTAPRPFKKMAVSFKAYESSEVGRTPDDEYCDALESNEARVLGKVGGNPLWIQGDETPSCACGSRMQFLLQIEEGSEGRFNFGGAGAGYAFICQQCPSEARFLWQC